MNASANEVAMRISVIVPVHNRAHTLERALRSILHQTVPVFEILVIDDGSTDRSAELVHDVGDPRIRYVFQSNGGAGSARNRGLDLARGDWIAFLDSDDWWGESRIASAVAALRSDPAIDLMQANRLYVEGDSSVRQGIRMSATQLVDATNLLSGFLIKTSAVVIRRDLIERHRLRFPVDQNTCEDYHLFWRALLFARRIAFTEAADVLIHELGDSLSRRHSAIAKQMDNIKTLIEVRAWAKSRRAKAEHVAALSRFLHWQLRDCLLMLMEAGHAADFVHILLIALRREGVVGALRSLVSALRAFAGSRPNYLVEL